MGRDLAIDLLQSGRPTANVSQFVRSHIASVDPAPRLECDHFDSRLRERQGGHTTRGPGADNDNIRLFQSSSHDVEAKYCGVWRISSEFECGQYNCFRSAVWRSRR